MNLKFIKTENFSAPLIYNFFKLLFKILPTESIYGLKVSKINSISKIKLVSYNHA